MMSLPGPSASTSSSSSSSTSGRSTTTLCERKSFGGKNGVWWRRDATKKLSARVVRSHGRIRMQLMKTTATAAAAAGRDHGNDTSSARKVAKAEETKESRDDIDVNDNIENEACVDNAAKSIRQRLNDDDNDNDGKKEQRQRTKASSLVAKKVKRQRKQYRSYGSTFRPTMFIDTCDESPLAFTTTVVKSKPAATSSSSK